MEPPAPTPPPQLRARDATVLPLTTLFTPPQSCFDAPFTLAYSSSGVAGFSTAWRDYDELSSQCYPSSFSSLEWNWNWYSPGVCPFGYDMAQTSITEDTTQAWCCPSSYTISGSIASPNTYQICSSLASSTALIDTANNATTTFTPTYSFVALQWPISVEWAASDLSIFTPASAPALTTGDASTISKFTGTLITSGGRNSRPTSTSKATAEADGGLSTGAEAGIAVGVVVAVVAILAGIAVWMIQRRRRSRQSPPDGPDISDRPLYVDYKFELPNEEPPRRKEHDPSPVELNAMSSPQELEVGDGTVKKVNSEQSPIELEGHWHGSERPG